MQIIYKILRVIIVAIMGGAISVCAMWQLMPIAGNCHILYVAQDELMAEEQVRIKDDGLDKQQLFFGAIEQAVKLATALPKTYVNRTTKVVYSISSVSGEGVRSISKEIHRQIIAELSKMSK
jgi:hypothetical protein